MMKNKKEKVDINLVKDNSKFEKVKLVRPNIKWNRCDIIFGDDFGLLEIRYSDKCEYISFYIEEYTCKLGVYMVEIPEFVFNSIVSFLRKNFNIRKIEVTQSINYKPGLKPVMHWLLELPETWEEFDNQFSSKTRYNRRYYKKQLEEKFGCVLKYFSEDEITEEFIANVFRLKEQKRKLYYDTDPKGFLSNYYKITDAYALYANDSLVSAVLYSIVDEHTAYCENFAYDLAYSKQNAGNVVYYESIKDLIRRGIKRVYMGGGDYEYKRNSKAIKTNTYNGKIQVLNFFQRIFSYYVEEKPVKRATIIILGIIISFKIKKK